MRTLSRPTCSSASHDSMGLTRTDTIERERAPLFLACAHQLETITRASSAHLFMTNASIRTLYRFMRSAVDVPASPIQPFQRRTLFIGLSSAHIDRIPERARMFTWLPDARPARLLPRRYL